MQITPVRTSIVLALCLALLSERASGASVSSPLGLGKVSDGAGGKHDSVSSPLYGDLMQSQNGHVAKTHKSKPKQVVPTTKSSHNHNLKQREVPVVATGSTGSNLSKAAAGIALVPIAGDIATVKSGMTTAKSGMSIAKTGLTTAQMTAKVVTSKAHIKRESHVEETSPTDLVQSAQDTVSKVSLGGSLLARQDLDSELEGHGSVKLGEGYERGLRRSPGVVAPGSMGSDNFVTSAEDAVDIAYTVATEPDTKTKAEKSVADGQDIQKQMRPLAGYKPSSTSIQELSRRLSLTGDQKQFLSETTEPTMLAALKNFEEAIREQDAQKASQSAEEIRTLLRSHQQTESLPFPQTRRGLEDSVPLGSLSSAANFASLVTPALKGVDTSDTSDRVVQVGPKKRGTLVPALSLLPGTGPKANESVQKAKGAASHAPGKANEPVQKAKGAASHAPGKANESVKKAKGAASHTAGTKFPKRRL
ncbi:hypothetical protein IE53DRAFT_138425 [Violaceomyces palustris]|uniref:Uncharacterized protein n=1 Tax=Violaceomyces palustris TaxID=1673888 RepID=A0ACD0NUR4_9BASI|nr:hypothetical protein IE53DRAFT_138425 [Violaceomyces palustris]